MMIAEFTKDFGGSRRIRGAAGDLLYALERLRHLVEILILLRGFWLFREKIGIRFGTSALAVIDEMLFILNRCHFGIELEPSAEIICIVKADTTGDLVD
jgi:hypothetical protein